MIVALIVAIVWVTLLILVLGFNSAAGQINERYDRAVARERRRHLRVIEGGRERDRRAS